MKLTNEAMLLEYMKWHIKQWPTCSKSHNNNL